MSVMKASCRQNWRIWRIRTERLVFSTFWIFSLETWYGGMEAWRQKCSQPQCFCYLLNIMACFAPHIKALHHLWLVQNNLSKCVSVVCLAVWSTFGVHQNRGPSNICSTWFGNIRSRSRRYQNSYRNASFWMSQFICLLCWIIAPILLKTCMTLRSWRHWPFPM